RVRRFGLAAPQQPGDWGVVRDGGIDWLARALPDLESEDALLAAKPARRGKPAAQSAEFTLQRLMPAEALRIQGAHNIANALAALALADAVGAPLAPLLHALRDYRGEPHRMQTVAEIDGVRWIDDSKGTNVGATVAALAGMDRPVVLIAGGDGKGQDFSPLRTQAARLRAAVLIGRDAQAIADALQGLVPITFTQSLEQAVQHAATLAQTGDAALLSPACASLDMFRNYAHRAEVFIAAVRELAEQRGQPWVEGGAHA
ncbi:MAG: glutamate ligase domain-containing protein, partial [Thiomonas sp.]